MSVSPPRRTLVLVFLLTFGFYAYFYQGAGANQFSRFLLTAALAREGTVRIDSHHAMTFDKSVKDGHYYTDKAPGLSILAIPFYLVTRWLLELLTAVSPWVMLEILLYTMTVGAVAIPVAVAAAVFFRRAWIESGPQAAFWVTVAVWLASPLAVYATMFYGHALAGALLWMAFVLVTPPTAGEESPANAPPPDADDGAPLWRFLLAGFLAGWAVLTEMPTALIVLTLFVHVCLSQPRPWRPALAYVAGGLPCAAILFWYNTAAFGSPLANGYQYCYVPMFRQAMSQGVMGVTGPSAASVLGVLVGPYRGLLFHWPFFLLCAVPAVVYLIARREFRGPALLSAVIVGVYLLFACSYFLWTGGASFGPRHLIPCLPFAGYLVVRAYQGVMRWVVPPVALLSFAVVLLAIATMPEFPEDIARPLFDFAGPRFLAGDLSVKLVGPLGVFVPSGTQLHPNDRPLFVPSGCNLGQLLGLRGLLSLAPLGAVLLLLGGALAWVSWSKPAPAPA